VNGSEADIVLLCLKTVTQTIRCPIIIMVKIRAGGIPQNIDRSIFAIVVVIITGHRITDRLAGNIFNTQPGLE
jgi:hypothetical protein